MELKDGRVVVQKPKDELPVIRIGRRLTDGEIEKLVAEAASKVSG